MQINSINKSQNHQPNFKSAIEIKIPKELFPADFNEEKVNNYFYASLNRAVENTPRKLSAKILNKLGIVPEAIGFMNYPGYDGLKSYIKENGKTWTEKRISYGYDLYDAKMHSDFDIKLPDVDEKNYKFYLLTGVDKDLFLSFQKQANKEISQTFERNKGIIETRSKKQLTPEDAILLRRQTRAIVESQAFDAATGCNIITTTFRTVKRLPEFLQILIKNT